MNLQRNSVTGNLLTLPNGNLAGECCCGCCGYLVPNQVRATISGLTDDPVRLAVYNGAHDLTWRGHGIELGYTCEWYGNNILAPLPGDLSLLRIWNPANASACSADGEHLWWLILMNTVMSGCWCYWSKSSSNGGDWAGNYVHVGTVGVPCAGSVGSSAVLGAGP